MNTPRDIAIPLRRITWRDGQTLSSRDLGDDQNYSSRLRHLHIRYLHKTWGVVEGLDIAAVSSSAVAIRPGYALDIEGRELRLPIVARISVPTNVTASTTMYLVLTQSTASANCVSPLDLATLCPGVRNPLPLAEGSLLWKTVSEVQLGKDVLLARALISGGNLVSVLDTSIRRRAVTTQQPRIWSDVTQQGMTGWIDLTGSPNNRLQEIAATVDTSDAGFIATPVYFAHLAGTSQVVPGFIASAHQASFTYVVRASDAMVPDIRLNAAHAESNGWTIIWLGVEIPAERLVPLLAQEGTLP
jgi:hypothetical protein